MNIKIVVASHKPYAMPSDGAYLPLQVGAAGKPSIRATGVLGVAGACAPEADFARDDEGENISSRNAGYCELTGLYWAWRNLKADAVGLSHYRRHFRGAHGVATGAEFVALLENFEVVLPRPRNYFIETTYSQYAHAHHAKDLDATRSVIEERCPEYLDSFDISMKSTKGHRFNMFVMRRERFNAYCDWLFGILFALEERIDVSNYSPYDARVFGFVGERLLDVWLGGPGGPPANAVAEMPVMHLESQRWPTKILNFLRRKFLPRK